MQNPFSPFLEKFGVVILDGALATELEARGADLNDPLWSAKILLEAPELIEQVHYDYFVAGADVAITASYQASLSGFMAKGLAEKQASDLIGLSVTLAQQARDRFWANPKHHQNRLRPLVAASVGCYGAFLHDGSEYRGDYGLSQQDLMDFHRPRLEILLANQPDVLACETIPCQLEAIALVELLAEFPQAKVWLSFSCKDEAHVCHGETLVECVALASQSEQVVAVGINCTAPRYIEGLLQSIAGITNKPIIIYPNSGEHWNAHAHCWEEGTGLSDFSQPAQHWYEQGARLIGGCCRTTPETVRQLVRVLHSL